MEWLPAFAHATLGLALDAAPWLLLGLVLAGLLKAFLSEAWLVRWVGGESLGAVVRAALVGAPLPLCSCSVLPTALGLRRQGAGKGPTLAFMIATPETGVDSVAVTYALLGPVYAVLRPLGALISAVTVGWAASRMGDDDGHPSAVPAAGSACATGRCGAGCSMPPPPPPAACAGGCPPPRSRDRAVLARTMEGVRYALTTLWDDLAPWLGMALLVAGALSAFAPPLALASLGQGLPGMLLMFVLGLPMYVCATAATPVAAALLTVGVGPGAVLVFLLAGPAANLGTLGVLKREFGGRLLTVYLVALATVTLLLGLLTEWLVGVLDLHIIPSTGEAEAASPVAWAALVVLVLLALAGLARRRRG
ncbi:MAG: SO_0444 family Cu/Zn efflux transporter [Gammaproteobacteria bacterium]|nr:SO_0444 family Cu/Zn efflux transporter [Gammaproteobacteria bacterium]